LLDHQDAMTDRLLFQLGAQPRQQLHQMMLAIAHRHDDRQPRAGREAQIRSDPIGGELALDPGQQLPADERNGRIPFSDQQTGQRIATNGAAGPHSRCPAPRPGKRSAAVVRQNRTWNDAAGCS